MGLPARRAERARGGHGHLGRPSGAAERRLPRRIETAVALIAIRLAVDLGQIVPDPDEVPVLGPLEDIEDLPVRADRGLRQRIPIGRAPHPRARTPAPRWSLNRTAARCRSGSGPRRASATRWARRSPAADRTPPRRATPRKDCRPPRARGSCSRSRGPGCARGAAASRSRPRPTHAATRKARARRYPSSKDSRVAGQPSSWPGSLADRPASR